MTDEEIAATRTRPKQPDRGDLRRAFACMAALALAGCQQFPWALDDGAPRGGNAPREREEAMNMRWKNRPFSELVGALGQPQLIMNIPGGGNPPGFAAVYGRDPVSGCIDAFAFLYGSDPIIRVYYCR